MSVYRIFTKNCRRFFVFIFVFSVATLMVTAQKKTITGTVTDRNGSPVREVLVLIDGKNTAIKTGENGYYRIKVRENAKTIGFFHFAIGMHEFPIDGRTEIDFVFPGKVAGPESGTVDIGYGTTKKEELTGSVSTVNAKDVNLENQTDLWQSLAGRVPGLEVIGSGSNVRLLIRGTGSVNSGTDPLIIVDGHPVNDLSSLNPHDVESISVIKDSSTAIYGARGANGVILITTKKAR